MKHQSPNSVTDWKRIRYLKINPTWKVWNFTFFHFFKTFQHWTYICNSLLYYVLASVLFEQVGSMPVWFTCNQKVPSLFLSQDISHPDQGLCDFSQSICTNAGIAPWSRGDTDFLFHPSCSYYTVIMCFHLMLYNLWSCQCHHLPYRPTWTVFCVSLIMLCKLGMFVYKSLHLKCWYNCYTSFERFFWKGVWIEM